MPAALFPACVACVSTAGWCGQALKTPRGKLFEGAFVSLDTQARSRCRRLLTVGCDSTPRLHNIHTLLLGHASMDGSLNGLIGRSFFVTKSVQPGLDVLGGVIECAGGTVLARLPVRGKCACGIDDNTTKATTTTAAAAARATAVNCCDVYVPDCRVAADT